MSKESDEAVHKILEKFYDYYGELISVISRDIANLPSFYSIKDEKAIGDRLEKIFLAKLCIGKDSKESGQTTRKE